MMMMMIIITQKGGHIWAQAGTENKIQQRRSGLLLASHQIIRHYSVQKSTAAVSRNRASTTAVLGWSSSTSSSEYIHTYRHRHTEDIIQQHSRVEPFCPVCRTPPESSARLNIPYHALRVMGCSIFLRTSPIIYPVHKYIRRVVSCFEGT